MKLLIVTQTIDRTDPILGFFHEWVKSFASVFDHVTVIALGAGERELPENVTVLSLGKEGGRSRIKYLKNFYRYIVAERNSYEAVFVHMNPIYVILGAPVWRIFGKKMSLWYVHKNVDLKLRLAVWLADRIFTASKESFRLQSDKVLVTGHGIDTDLFKPLPRAPKAEKVVATIGRIAPIKNIDFLIRSFSRARDSLGVPARFEIVGNVSESDKEYKKGLEKLCRDLQVERSVVFREPIRNASIPEYLRGVDLTMNASETGSFDKAVLESMACGVPALTANEAFRDLASPFGLYVDGKDEKKFSAAISALIERGCADASGLREAVKRGHSLENLADKIASGLSN